MKRVKRRPKKVTQEATSKLLSMAIDQLVAAFSIPDENSWNLYHDGRFIGVFNIKVNNEEHDNNDGSARTIYI